VLTGEGNGETYPTAVILTPSRHSLDNNEKFQRTNPNPKLNPN